MSKATVKNDIQVILQEYLGNTKVAEVAEAVYAVMQGKTQHTHNGKMFYINEDSDGALVMVKEKLETILKQNLEKDDVQECLQRLMVVDISTETELTAEFETITVEGSDSQIYSDMLEYTPANDAEKRFLQRLKKAVDAGVKPFKVPVCDPSIAKDGSLQFVAGCEPAAGYSYSELKKLEIKNGVQLGSKNQYVLFLATIIHRLVEEGWTKANAIYAVCTDSTEVGHYWNSKKAKHYFEVTGSRKIAGKCDLANTYKILAKDEKAGGFWLAGGSYNSYGDNNPLACLNHDYDDGGHYYRGVGWFVL